MSRIGPCLCLFLGIVATGCAPKIVAPPPQDVRDRMDHVALRVSSPADGLNRPDARPAAGSGEGAAYGAKSGAKSAIGAGVLVGGAAGCNQAWGPFIIIACPFGLVGGAAAGIAAAIPAAAIGAAVAADKAEAEDKVAGTEETFRAVVADTDLTAEMRRRLRTSIRDVAGATVVDSGEGAAGSGKSAAPSQTHGMIVDVVIERAAIGLTGKLEPDLHIAMEVKAGLRRPARQGWLYERSWGYRAKLGEYFPLLEDDGADLRRKIGEAFDRVARAVVVDLFLSDRPVPATPKAQISMGRVVTTGGPILDPKTAAPKQN